MNSSNLRSGSLWTSLVIFAVGLFVLSGLGMMPATASATGPSSAITPSGVPTAPTGFSVSTIGHTTANLSWTNPPGTLTADTVQLFYGGGYLGYYVSSCLSTQTGNYVKLATITLGVVTSYELKNLSAGDHYCVNVYASNATGAGGTTTLLAFSTTPLSVSVGAKLKNGGDGIEVNTYTAPANHTAYDNLYGSLTPGSLVGCPRLCMNVSFPTAITTFTNESAAVSAGINVAVTWGYTARALQAGVQVLGIAILGGVVSADCNASGGNSSGYYSPYSGYIFEPGRGSSGWYLSLNNSGMSAPWYLNSTVGGRLEINDTSSLNNGTWVFHHVPTQTEICVVMMLYKTGGYFGDIANGTFLGADTREAMTPGWNAGCSVRNGASSPGCIPFGLQIQYLTTSSAVLSWNLSTWTTNYLDKNYFNNGTARINYALYQWNNITSIPWNSTKTNGVLLFKSAVPDDNNYIVANRSLTLLSSGSIDPGMAFSSVNTFTGLKKNTEYAFSMWTSGLGYYSKYSSACSCDVAVYYVSTFGNLDFFTANTAGVVVNKAPMMTGLNATSVAYKTFAATSTATRTTSLVATLYLLSASNQVYSTTASQTPCTSYTSYLIGTQTFAGTGNTTITVGGASSGLAGDNYLSPNSTYCIAEQAKNNTGSGSFLNMTVYTNPYAGNSSGFTIFSVSATSLTYQWYIGLSTTSVYLAVYSASGGGFSQGAPCVSGGGITFTLFSNTTVSANLQPGLNRFLASGLTTHTYYCAALGSAAGSYPQNVLYVKGYTQTPSGTLTVTNLQVTSSTATQIAFSWTNAASSSPITVYLSVWTLNVAYNVCTGSTVTNSTELIAYTTVNIGGSSVTSYTLDASKSLGLYTNGTYCIGVANSNNTLGQGPFALVLGSFTTGGGSSSLIVLNSLDWLIIGFVAVVIVVVVIGITVRSRGPRNLNGGGGRSMHSRRR